MNNKLYKVVRRSRQNPEYQWKRISSSVRAHQFIHTYPVGCYTTMRIGLAFCFLDETAAHAFRRTYDNRHCRLEVWMCDTYDRPIPITRQARYWVEVPLFWDLIDRTSLESIAYLLKISEPCPPGFYGVRTIKLIDRIG